MMVVVVVLLLLLLLSCKLSSTSVNCAPELKWQNKKIEE